MISKYPAQLSHSMSVVDFARLNHSTSTVSSIRFVTSMPRIGVIPKVYVIGRALADT